MVIGYLDTYGHTSRPQPHTLNSHYPHPNKDLNGENSMDIRPLPLHCILPFPYTLIIPCFNTDMHIKKIIRRIEHKNHLFLNLTLLNILINFDLSDRYWYIYYIDMLCNSKDINSKVLYQCINSGCIRWSVDQHRQTSLVFRQGETGLEGRVARENEPKWVMSHVNIAV